MKKLFGIYLISTPQPCFFLVTSTGWKWCLPEYCCWCLCQHSEVAFPKERTQSGYIIRSNCHNSSNCFWCAKLLWMNFQSTWFLRSSCCFSYTSVMSFLICLSWQQKVDSKEVAVVKMISVVSETSLLPYIWIIIFLHSFVLRCLCGLGQDQKVMYNLRN